MSSSPSTDPPPSAVEKASHHAGHDLESGVLARARSWVDVFGWIRLGRVMRVAGSPVMVALTALTTALWLPIWNLCLGSELLWQLPPTSAHAVATTLWERPLWCAISFIDLVQSLFAAAIFTPWTSDLEGWLRLLASILWTILVWAPTAMILQRQGALLTAGRPMLPVGDVARWAARRYWRACAAAIVPALCIASILWAVALLGALLGSVEETWVMIPLAFVIAGIALPAGFLAFGSIVAVPISWAALINEREPDPLDSLSRGYEYLFRRPLQLLALLVVSLVILAVVAYLATFVVSLGYEMIAGPLALVSADFALAAYAQAWLRHCPLILGYTVSWALVGGIYLLLRFHAGGQEVEDLWITSAHPAQPLPELKSQA